MNFISTEEFLKQPKKVQNIFKNWWKPQAGDLVHDKINIVGVIVPALCIGDYKSNLDKNKVTPLLQMHQLIGFIEDKTESIVQVSYCFKENDATKRGYMLHLMGDGGANSHYKNLGEDLLQAYWQIACRIAEYEV
ncbi:hypothetical protein FDA84_15090 [Clostridium botulinum]|nr:hypothetical protein [Clostridium botulinum]